MKDPMQKAVRVAWKKLPFTSDRALGSYLGCACGSMADAYRLGAEEAQDEIVRRLQMLISPSTPDEVPK